MNRLTSDRFHSLSRCGDSRGFSLVEIIVAAGIAAVTILVLVGVIRKGMEITTTSQHYQRARAVIDSCFESPAFRYDNYALIPSVDSVVVLLDPRKDGDVDDLNGVLRISVVTDTNRTALTGQDPNDLVEYKRVAMTVSWAEPEGQESITLEKLITDLNL